MLVPFLGFWALEPLMLLGAVPISRSTCSRRSQSSRRFSTSTHRRNDPVHRRGLGLGRSALEAATTCANRASRGDRVPRGREPLRLLRSWPFIRAPSRGARHSPCVEAHTSECGRVGLADARRVRVDPSRRRGLPRRCAGQLGSRRPYRRRRGQTRPFQTNPCAAEVEPEMARRVRFGAHLCPRASGLGLYARYSIDRLAI